MHSCSRIPVKQWFLWDIPSVARIVGRYAVSLYGQKDKNVKSRLSSVNSK